MKKLRKKKITFLIVFLLFFAAITVLAIKGVIDRHDIGGSMQKTERRHLSVRCVRAISGPIRAVVFGEGTARAVRREFLTFELQGKVTYIKKNKDGQTLHEGNWVCGPKKSQMFGELLASIDKRQHVEQLRVTELALQASMQQVEVTRSQLVQAEAQFQLAKNNLMRYEKLYKEGAISKYELDIARTRARTSQTAVISARARLKAALLKVKSSHARVEQAKLLMERSSIYAPFDGVLTYMNINEGDYFAPNLVDTTSEDALLRTIPMVVIDPSQFEVVIELPFFEGKSVRPGQQAFISSTGFLPYSSDPESRFFFQNGVIRATVYSVSPAFTPGGRAMQIRIRTEKGKFNIKDGMFVGCWIVVTEKKDAILVPFDVFVYRQNIPYVFVVDQEKGIVEQRKVIEGITGPSRVEILEGVQEGSLLVTDGRYQLTHGAPVEIIGIVREK